MASVTLPALKLSYPVILIGGKAMEVHKLRKSGGDVDCVVHPDDFRALKKLYGQYKHFPPHTPGVKCRIDGTETDFFHSINGYGWGVFIQRSVEVKPGLHVAHQSDLVLLAAIRAFDEQHHPPPPPEGRVKAFQDLDLLINGKSTDVTKRLFPDKTSCIIC